MILYRHNYFIENRYISTLHMHILDQFLKRRLLLNLLPLKAQWSLITCDVVL